MLYKQGDLVIVVDHEHPAYGKTGTIEVSPRLEVLAENWMGCYREVPGRDNKDTFIHYYVELTEPIKVPAKFKHTGLFFSTKDPCLVIGIEVDSNNIMKD